MRYLIAFAALVTGSTAGAQEWGTGVGTLVEPACCGTYTGNVSGTHGDNGVTKEVSKSASETYSGTDYEGKVVSAVASAYADLSTGKMGVSASSSHNGSAGAGSMIYESLAFDVFGATSETVTSIGIDFLYHGTFSPPLEATSEGSQFVFNLQSNDYLGNIFGGGGLSVARSEGVLSPDYFFYSQAGWSTFDIVRNGDYTHIYTTIDLLGKNPIIDFQASLSAWTKNEGSANFGNTAGVTFTLPQGVSYTSSSGVFLANVSPVPEPTTWTLLILGFGAFGGAMRKRREVPLSPA